MSGKTPMLNVEFSYGRLSGTDVQALEFPLRALLTRARDYIQSLKPAVINKMFNSRWPHLVHFSICPPSLHPRRQPPFQPSFPRHKQNQRFFPTLYHQPHHHQVQKIIQARYTSCARYASPTPCPGTRYCLGDCATHTYNGDDPNRL